MDTVRFRTAFLVLFVATITCLLPLYAEKENGQFSISMQSGESWKPVGTLAFGKHYSTHSLPLAISTLGPVALKISSTVPHGAHIDALFLGARPPKNLTGAPLSDGVDKLRNSDYDVIDATGSKLVVQFDPAGPAPVLRMRARIEPEQISPFAFMFPRENNYHTIAAESRFYRYQLNSNRLHRTIDGDLSGEELNQPFFQSFSVAGSGHPSADAYGWVSNDDENLYVILDFLSDNTMDGTKDYGKVYINTGDAVREFKVSVDDRQWGTPGFTYTPRVPYQHKVYEFQIPLDEAQVTTRDQVELAFSLYGTSALPVHTIDDFNNPDGTSLVALPIGGGNFGSLFDGAMYMGERDVYAHQNSGTSNTIQTYGGQFQIAIGSSFNFYGTMTWDGNDNQYASVSVLESQRRDFRNVVSFVLKNVQNTGTDDINLSFRAYGQSDQHYFYTFYTTIPGSSGPMDIHFYKGDFSNYNGTSNWNDIRALQLRFNNAEATEFDEMLNMTLTMDEVGYTGDISLPVSMVNFSSSVLNEGVLLSWIVASESDNAGYYIYRAQGDSDDFQRLSPLIPGVGSTSEQQNYSFVDRQVQPECLYRYKISHLQAVTGEEVFSQEIMVYTDQTVQTVHGYVLKNNYPNPFNPSSTIPFVLMEKQRIKIRIFNVQGQIVQTLVDEVLNAGAHKIDWDAGNLPAGFYFYRLEGEYFSDTKKAVLAK